MSGEMNQLQKKQLQILKEFKKVCKKNNLLYFLTGGTLIGAVRHKGFIPWDDDIDVMMPFSDYGKLDDACEKDMENGFFLQTGKSDLNAHLTYKKIRMDGTTFIVDYLADCDIHHGIDMDVYPIYNIADGKIGRTIQYLNTMLYFLFEVGEAPKNHGLIMTFGSNVLLWIFRGKVRDRIKEHCHKKMAKYENKKTKYKGLLFGNMTVSKVLYPAEFFESAVEAEFEDEMFTIPSYYDEILRIDYGDYMTIPPVEERGVKLDHIFIDTEKSYLEYKGKEYCKSIK